MHQAGRELAGAGRYAGDTGYYGLAAGAASVTARPTGYDPRPDCPLRPEWAIRGQYVGNVNKTLLRDIKAQLSHSRRGRNRKGECYNNALTGTTQAESL